MSPPAPHAALLMMDTLLVNPFYVEYLFRNSGLHEDMLYPKWYRALPFKEWFGVTNRWFGRHDWPRDGSAMSQPAASTTTLDLKLAIYKRKLGWAFHEIESTT